MYNNDFAVHLKLTQHRKSTIFQLKKFKREMTYKCSHTVKKKKTKTKTKKTPRTPQSNWDVLPVLSLLGSGIF